MYIDGFTYSYPNKEKPVLQEINMTVKKGQFILLLGKSGSGKSTLAKAIAGLVPEFYGGTVSGQILKSEDASILFQDPENQLVMSTVDREIAFSLENQGMKREEMLIRVREITELVGLEYQSASKTMNLSGGQKQKVAFAGILSMQRKIIVLDEPTSQLDPVSANEILEIAKKLNQTLGYTVIMIEQRIERCIDMADRIIFMDDYKIAFDGSKNDFAMYSCSHDLDFLPPVAQFFIDQGITSDIPLNVTDAKKRIMDFKIEIIKHPKIIKLSDECSIEIRDLDFSYDNANDVISQISMSIPKASILGIMGENGSGKSTLLKIITGLLKKYRGYVDVKGKIGFLSQNPNDYLFNDTVEQELEFTMKTNGIYRFKDIDRILEDLDILSHKYSNPRDLSGGERQRAAIAAVLSMDSDIIILDEPTRGLDRSLKRKLNDIIHKIKDKGKTVIIVTHDVEFAAATCDKIALLSAGRLIGYEDTNKMFTKNSYYKTQISEMLDEHWDNPPAVTLKDAAEYIRLRKI